MPKERRQLIAALFADITGYTALMQTDEQKALSSLTIFKNTLESQAAVHSGNIIQYYGDGCLVTFQSSKDAVECARDMQSAYSNIHKIPVRIGIHLGDAVFRDGNVFGDSVNLASRIESMGVPGSVLFSQSIYEQIKNQEGIEALSLGKFEFKNVEKPLEVYALSMPGFQIPNKNALNGKFKTQVQAKKRIGVIALIAILLLLGYLYTQFPLSAKSEMSSGIKTLGILPFEIPDNDDALKYLAEGIPENLINRMSALDNIKVLSRYSTFSMADSRNELEKLRTLLKADVILTGSITTVQNHLVLNCQLIDLETGNQIWGDRLRHPYGDIFALEDSIVNALVAPLEISMLNTTTKYTPSPDAYTHYLKGRFLTYGSTPEEAEIALDHFRKAVEIDPQFALAYAGIAKVKFVQVMFGSMAEEDLLREALVASQNAKLLDPGLVEAHLAEANIHFYIEHNWVATEKAFQKAFKADPRNVDLNIEFAHFKNMMGDFEDARDMADVALELDPISTASLHMAAWTRMFTGDYEEAAELLTTAVELNPDWVWGWLKLGCAQALGGHCQKAIESVDKSNSLAEHWGSELVQAYVCGIYVKCGATEKSEAAFQRMIMHADTAQPNNPVAYMMLSAARQDREQVLYWAEKVISENSVYCYGMYLLPKFELFASPAFDDPRYRAIVRSLDFPHD